MSVKTVFFSNALIVLKKQSTGAIFAEKEWLNINVLNVGLRDHKMAHIVITFKIMPKEVETDLVALQKECEQIISKIGEIGKVDIQPIAFGLKALFIYVVADESKGSPDDIEKQLNELDNTMSVEITDVRRTLDI